MIAIEFADLTSFVIARCERRLIDAERAADAACEEIRAYSPSDYHGVPGESDRRDEMVPRHLRDAVYALRQALAELREVVGD